MAIKTAVILLNLGGPSSLDKVKPFLFSLFYDKTIINLPNPFRWLIAKLISNLRNSKAKKIYSLIGGKSPIVEETKNQATALQQQLDEKKYKVFVCMRHSSPNIDQLEKEIEDYKPDQIIGIPLYPQFSYTTSYSAIEEIKNRFKNIKLKFIGCFYTCPKYIQAQSFLINQAIEKNQIELDKAILLFSAHSLPIKIIQKGDPYQSQIQKTVELILKEIPKIEHKITYQSKVGPIKWLEPKTEDEIKKACIEKKQIIIVPISFVSEHSETLVELDIEYADIAKKYSNKYIRVSTVRNNQKFISCLKDLVENCTNQEQQTTSQQQVRLCDEKFKYCICR